MHKPIISQNSQSLLKKMGRHKKTESIEDHLLREGQKMQINREKLRRKKEETEKIKKSALMSTSHNSSRSTIDPKKPINKLIFPTDIRKALFQEEIEPENHEIPEIMTVDKNSNHLQDVNYLEEETCLLKERKIFPQENIEEKAVFSRQREMNNEISLLMGLNPSSNAEAQNLNSNKENQENSFNQSTKFFNKCLTPSKSLKLFTQRAFLQPKDEEPPQDKSSVDIYNKFLLKKMTHKQDHSSFNEENSALENRPIIYRPSKNERPKSMLPPTHTENQENDSKAPSLRSQIKDPLSLFEKKPYQLKEFQSKESPKGAANNQIHAIQKTGSFNSKTHESNGINDLANQGISPAPTNNNQSYQLFSFKPEKSNFEENETFGYKAPPNPKEEKTKQTKNYETENNKLKNIFVDSKTFFKKHHSQNQGIANSALSDFSQENNTNPSSVWAFYQYEQKKNNKASPESLLTSLRYREQKVFSYHDNKLAIQDKSEDCYRNPKSPFSFPEILFKFSKILTKRTPFKTWGTFHFMRGI